MYVFIRLELNRLERVEIRCANNKFVERNPPPLLALVFYGIRFCVGVFTMK